MSAPRTLDRLGDQSNTLRLVANATDASPPPQPGTPALRPTTQDMRPHPGLRRRSAVWRAAREIAAFLFILAAVAGAIAAATEALR